jgi:hypothetical protein
MVNGRVLSTGLLAGFALGGFVTVACGGGDSGSQNAASGADVGGQPMGNSAGMGGIDAAGMGGSSAGAGASGGNAGTAASGYAGVASGGYSGVGGSAGVTGGGYAGISIGGGIAVGGGVAVPAGGAATNCATLCTFEVLAACTKSPELADCKTSCLAQCNGAVVSGTIDCALDVALECDADGNVTFPMKSTGCNMFLGQFEMCLTVDGGP